MIQGYENQEHFSRLLGQTYIIAGLVRPAVQNPIVASAPVVENIPVQSVQPPVLPTGAQSPGIPRRTSEEDPIDILDSNNEL